MSCATAGPEARRPHGRASCAPKAGTYSQAAAAWHSPHFGAFDAQAALAAIAKEEKLLDVKVKIRYPNVRREVASSIALLDTARH